MKPFDPSLYLVTDRRLCKPGKLVQAVQEAVRGGITMVQLRDKHSSRDEILRLADALLKFLSPLRIPLIINDDPELARQVGADGVHLGQTDGNPVEARQMLGPNRTIGLSIESNTSLLNVPFNILDYVSASPVFSTPTKTDTREPFLLDGLRKLKSQCPIPLIAIGGIKACNVREVLLAGADGIAVVSAIMASDNPYLAAQELWNEIFRFRKETL